jgi:hypothetical protein
MRDAPLRDSLDARYYVGRLRYLALRYGWPGVVQATHALYTALQTGDRAAVQDALNALQAALTCRWMSRRRRRRKSPACMGS